MASLAVSCTAACRYLLRAIHSSAMSAAAEGPKTAPPPPDTARGATADLADVFIPEPVDQVSQCKVQIMEPIFQLSANRSHAKTGLCLSC